MNAFTYFENLSKLQREAFAKKAGTTIAYARAHLFSRNGPRKTPSHKLVVSLAAASEGHVSLDEAIDYFHIQPIKALAKEMQGDLLPEIKPLESRAPAKQIEMKILNKPERVNL